MENNEAGTSSPAKGEPVTGIRRICATLGLLTLAIGATASGANASIGGVSLQGSVIEDVCSSECSQVSIPATRVSLVNGVLSIGETGVGVVSSRNDVTVTSSGSTWTVSDPGGVAPGPNCLAPPTGGRSVQCTGTVSTVAVTLGGQSDRLKFTSTSPAPVSVDGGDDNDTISVSTAASTQAVNVQAGWGSDTVTVSGGRPAIDGSDDTAFDGSDDNDVITVHDSYPATIYGGIGNIDKITTGRILGSATGENQIYPGPKRSDEMVNDVADIVTGGPGRDRVYSSGNGIAGGDYVSGGAGFDTQDYSYYGAGSVAVSTYDNASNDGTCSGLFGSHADNIHSDVEQVIGRGSTGRCQSPVDPKVTAYGDIIIGSAVNNTFPRSDGSDYLDGGAGTDTLDGTVVYGGPGRDRITGNQIHANDDGADLAEYTIACIGSGHAYLDGRDPNPSGTCHVHRPPRQSVMTVLPSLNL